MGCRWLADYWHFAEILEPLMDPDRLAYHITHEIKMEAIDLIKRAGIDVLSLDGVDRPPFDLIYEPLWDFREIVAELQAREGFLTPDSLYCDPVQELYQASIRISGFERDWHARWRAAGDAVGWAGAFQDEMIARTDSPIWEALGNGVGGYEGDAFGYPVAPFAPCSGVKTNWIGRDEAVARGLVSR